MSEREDDKGASVGRRAEHKDTCMCYECLPRDATAQAIDRAVDRIRERIRRDERERVLAEVACFVDCACGCSPSIPGLPARTLANTIEKLRSEP